MAANNDPRPSPAPPPQPPELEGLRRRIDDLDKQIVEMLNQRSRIVVEVGRVKRNGNWPIYAPEREQKVLEHVRGCNQGPLPDRCLEAIWR
jgi:chorismate mutase / prephenate dehydratase